MEQIAQSIPHEYRVKILLEWLPVAMADMANEAMRLLFDAWFLFVEPNGIKKADCPICVRNILDNWKQLAEYLAKEEEEDNLLKAL